METRGAWQIGSFGSIAHSDIQNFAPRIRIADCTLRDGEQQAGVVFTRQDKLAIARELDRLGVDEIEAGTPVSSQEDRAAVEEIAAAGLSAKISALARARPDDIDVVADCGVGIARLSMPISDIQRNAKLKLSDDEYLKRALEITEYAKKQGLSCVFSPYDTTRCNLDLLRKLLGAFERSGTVDRVRLVDTTGCATPEIVRFLVREMKQAANIPVEVHCHNDFGLAVANTIAGAQAGAEYLSVTINGIGERCGNASLEECAVALKILYGIDVGIALEQLTAIARQVEARSGVALQAHKAVVGSNAFAHESGMVVAGLLRDPFTAEAYDPGLVGQTRSIVLGKKSGVASVQARAEQIGVRLSDPQVAALLEAVKLEAIRTKKPVGEERFRELARAAAAQG